MGRGARRCDGKAYCLVVDFVYMIEGYGYSMNFAQFFKKNEVKQLEEGLMYVGPSESEAHLRLPENFTRGAKVVSIVELARKVVPLANGWLTVAQIKHAVGRSLKWVVARLPKLEVKPESRLAPDGNVHPHYPPTVVAQLKALDTVVVAGDWLSIPRIATAVGRSGPWVVSHLAEIGVKSEEREADNKKTTPHYPSTVVAQLKALDKAPNAGDWLGIPGLATAVGRSVTWVAARLSELGIKPEERRAIDGQVYPHYPLTVVPQLKELNKAPEAGDWLTTRGIASALKRHELWITPRLKELGVEPEDRKAPDGNVHPHYPPTVVPQLKALDTAPKAGDWLTLLELSTKIGRDRRWIKNRLKELGIKPEERRRPRGSVHPHYPPTAVEKLKGPDPIKAAGDWLTAGKIASLVKRDRMTVVRYLVQLEIKSEERRTPEGQKLPHYPPHAVEAVRNHGKK